MNNYDLKTDSFINQIKSKVRRKIENDLNNFNPPFNYKDEVSPNTKEVLKASFSIIENFFYKLYQDRMPNKKIEEKIQRYTENSSFYSDDALKKLYEIRKDKFSHEDITYIKFTKLTHTWDGKFNYSYGDKYAILDVLFKGSLASEVDLIYKKDLENLKKVPNIDKIEYNKRKAEIEAERKNNIEYLDKIFPLKVSDVQYNRTLEDQIEKEVNNILNDGSYALEIDTIILPFGYSDINKSVSCILNNFPFVRLLGNTTLKSNEYLVLYRCDNSGNRHQFVKVETDGKLTEKPNCSAVQDFHEWDEKLDSPVVVFAVKKKHKNFGYRFMDIKVYPDNDLNFQEALSRAIKYKQNFFLYRGRNFEYSVEGDIFKIKYNKNHIANSYYEGDSLIIESKPSNERIINSLSPVEAPIIENGFLTNIINYKESNSTDEGEENNKFIADATPANA